MRTDRRKSLPPAMTVTTDNAHKTGVAAVTFTVALHSRESCTTSRLSYFGRRKVMMKYGVEVVILQYGYVEIEADCPSEAEHIAEQKALNGDIDFHESEAHEIKIVCHVYE